MFDASNLALFALAAVAGGGGYAAYHAMQSEPGVYPQPREEVYSRLATADLQFVDSQLKSFRFAVSGNGSDRVVWETQGLEPARTCTIALTPLGEQTRAALTCSEPLAGAEPMVRLRDELFHNAVAEMVEATISGKPIPSYEKQMFEGAATALHGGGAGYNRALSDAVSTKRAIDQQLAEMAAEQHPETQAEESLDQFYAEADDPAFDPSVPAY